jgi:hypothetical protein
VTIVISTTRTPRTPLVIAALLLSCAVKPGLAQVSPAEIRDPQLKALESGYLSELRAASREIARLRFPFQFVLSRYVGLDPKDQVGADTRGLEFVKFHDHAVLKVTGNYNAAYNAALLTDNQRADRVMEHVISPMIEVLCRDLPSGGDYSRFGFEVSFHVRRRESSYDYEGKEILVLVLDRKDAEAWVKSRDAEERQAILDRSEVYLNGKAYGLALGERDAYPAGEGGDVRRTVAAKPVSGALNLAIHTVPVSRPPAMAATPAPQPAVVAPAAPAPQSEDKAALQSKYQSELEALDREGRAHFQFVAYAPPEFVTFRNQTYLQITMRNPEVFDRDATSIYKRAAKSFDLFLAPALKPLLAKVPVDDRIAGLDITVLVESKPQSAASPTSEAFEFICPGPAIRRFAAAETTNQELIDNSMILVNGVRIALDLQRVE